MNLEEIKRNLLSFCKPKDKTEELYQLVKEELIKLGIEVDEDITDIINRSHLLWWFSSMDDGIRGELNIIRAVITKSLQIPKIFQDDIILLLPEYIENPHNGDIIGTKIKFEISSKKNLISSVRINPYNDYQALSWLMDNSDHVYQVLERIKEDLFPMEISK